MGPRPFGRGNAKIRYVFGGKFVLLQWGRGLSAAEMPGISCSPRWGNRLQWGRGLSAAEISSTDRDAVTPVY